MFHTNCELDKNQIIQTGSSATLSIKTSNVEDCLEKVSLRTIHDDDNRNCHISDIERKAIPQFGKWQWQITRSELLVPQME